MPTLQIELSCPYEVFNDEWLEIVDMINQNILRGNYATVSARITGGLTKRAVDVANGSHNHILIDGVCRNCGEVLPDPQRN